MKASTVIAIAVGLTASTVSAQLDQLPTCALTCALGGISASGCPSTDIACICGANAFIASLLPCVQAGCTPAELETTIQAASALCASAGVTLSVPPVGGSSTSAPSSSASATETETVVSTTTEVTEPTVEPPVTNSTTTSEEPVPEPTGGNTTTGVNPPEPSGTGSSASRNAVALGGLGALAAFVAALL